MTDNSQKSSYAEIKWNELGQPVSSLFNDIYFSKQDGLTESRYVFLQQNQLTERFEALADKAIFTIGETGFGTGLNFLAAMVLWLQSAPKGARLHYISVEKHPLSQQDLIKALSLWPQLQCEAEELSLNYPTWPLPGCHRIQLAQGRIHLTLIIDDAAKGFEQLLQSTHPAFSTPTCHVDAWFLDGFAPAKNPAMWSRSLFSRLQQLSRKGTTLATFTAARVVKEGLQQHGFAVDKVPGYGNKRDMLRAVLCETYKSPDLEDFPLNARNSDFPLVWHISKTEQEENANRSATIIGGGIAGATTAAALAHRGWHITLLERHPMLALEGSGNRQGIVYGKLSHRSETLSNFNAIALQYALRYYRQFWRSTKNDFGRECGVLQLSHNEKAQIAQQNLIEYLGNEQQLCRGLTQTQASQVSGIELPCGGLFFPDSGWIYPAAICAELTNHPNIEIHYNCSVNELDWDTDTNSWHLQLNNQRHCHPATTVILCSANEVNNVAQISALPLKPVAGQVTHLSAGSTSTKLQTVLCGDGYMAPKHQNQHCIGATFRLNDMDCNVREQDHHHNLQELAAQIPSLAEELVAKAVTGGRAALRCTTPDYLPITGPAPNYDGYLKAFQLLRQNARANIPRTGPHWPNLYVNTGFGSRGLTYAPLCAEMLACQLSAEPSPLGTKVEIAMHPGRFWIRDLIRKKI